MSERREAERITLRLGNGRALTIPRPRSEDQAEDYLVIGTLLLEGNFRDEWGIVTWEDTTQEEQP